MCVQQTINKTYDGEKWSKSVVEICELNDVS